MKLSKTKSVNYRNDKVEISGDYKDVKGHIWFDLISSRLYKIIWSIVTITVFIFLLRPGDIQSTFPWLRKLLGLIRFCMTITDMALLFSG